MRSKRTGSPFQTSGSNDRTVPFMVAVSGMMLNAVPAEDKTELEHLQQDFMSQPSVVAYLQAQNDLMALSQACASLLSQATGLNYSASCGSSCCG